ncbi:elongation factor P hydroxylase [Aliikangiella sp. IMCC44632]
MNNIEVLKLKRLQALFNQTFRESRNTLLQVGASEPFYAAAKLDEPAIIYSRENFLSSALHEIAHWTIAGTARRKLDDYGYWYAPDGRTQEQQAAFEQVEVKPQAIEWILSDSLDHSFHFSADNIELKLGPSAKFVERVTAQRKAYLSSSSLPIDAQMLLQAIAQINFKPSGFGLGKQAQEAQAKNPNQPKSSKRLMHV